MVIDYKHVGFSFKDKKRKKRLKRLKLVTLIMVVLLVFFLITNTRQVKKINKIQSLLINNQREDALEIWTKLENSLLHKKTLTELRALIHLFYQQPGEAQELFDRLKRARTRVQYKKFLNYFTDNSEYLALKIYTDFLINRGEKVLLYRALTQTALFEPKQSEKSLSQISLSEQEEQLKAIAILRELNSQLKSGRIDFVFDTNGNPLARYDFRGKKSISLAPGMGFDDFNQFMKNGMRRYSLTINLNIQRTIHQLFKEFHGSMLLFKLEDSSILAAYSKPLKKNPDSVFHQEYEPGSIIKVLTLFTFYTNPVKDFFPFECRRGMVLNNHIFPDRMAHGRIKNPQVALSVSCNIAFAKMGLGAGFKSLSRTLDSFYFNSQGFQDLFLHFQTGSYNKKIVDDYALANLSVGLNEISITTYHSALLAVIIAQNGSIYRPHMINNIKNILNLGFYNHQPELIKVTNSHPAYLKIKQAMVGVVENPDGTGRHSRVDFVKTAIKTGTAGSKRLGLDSIILGFFPADKPEYAFAFRLERAGKAEIKGAAFLKRFLTRFYRRREK